MQSSNQYSLLSHQQSYTKLLSSASPHDSVISEDIPSTSYQFSRWFELDSRDASDGASADSSVSLTGSTLLSPRVREGPANVTSLYASHSIMYSKKTQDWIDHRNMSEDWEHTEAVNLSYQDLGEDYQFKNLHRCLNRLVTCKHLQLMDNSLSNIKKVTLPSCVHLNLSRNSFSSFRSLPKAPNLEHLSMADNNISSLRSLSTLRSKYPHLKTLVLKGNPVSTHYEYRHRVFQVLPVLELLDGYPSLPSDKDLLSSSSSCSFRSTNSEKCTVS